MNPAKYDFKILKYNGESVFLPSGSVFDFYKPQSCRVCNYCSKGYYLNVRTPQNFECVKCLNEWSIVSCASNTEMNRVERLLEEIDDRLSSLFEITGKKND